jgi:solute carrier family 35 protein E1
MWYLSSALTNTSSKSILNAFNKPATLTVVQFAMVSLYCVLASGVASIFPSLRTRVPALRHPIRRPSRHVLSTTLPLAVFQIAGHLLSSKATAMIPVSQVHTIKGLSPLFTVFAYRLVYDIRYPMATYMSLIPLTCGVMLACSGKSAFGGHFLGNLYALLAAIIFVTQNIFSKKLFNEAAVAERQTNPAAKLDKLDKLNLLCYSSGLAFVMTLPIWALSEGVGLVGDVFRHGSVQLSLGPHALDHSGLAMEFFFNGTFHWGQNILAFVLLSMVSPVTYSVASLLKRVFVIVIAIVWFRNPITQLQGFGIFLTFLGLYLYDRSSESNKADRKARAQTSVPLTPRARASRNEPLLPLSAVSSAAASTTTTIAAGSPYVSAKRDSAASSSTASGSGGGGSSNGMNNNNNNMLPPLADDKKSDGFGVGNGLGGGTLGWLPPGTHQEETWRMADRNAVGV